MKYKKYLEKIMAALNEYKEAVDGIVVRCKAEEKKRAYGKEQILNKSEAKRS